MERDGAMTAWGAGVGDLLVIGGRGSCQQGLPREVGTLASLVIKNMGPGVRVSSMTSNTLGKLLNFSELTSLSITWK